jgi:hypothetical protein
MEFGKAARQTAKKAARAAKRMADKGVKEVKAAAGDKSMQKLKQWQEWFKDAKRDFQPQLDLMDRREDLYAGSKTIQPGPNARRTVAKEATTVQNYTAELIETEVKSDIPYPIVSPKRQKDEALARRIEAMLRSDIDRLPLEALNDEMERTTPIQGGSWLYVDWDNSLRTHTSVGDTTVSVLHPKQVLPQDGVKDIHKGKRCFVMMSWTKAYIKERWGVDVTDESEEYPDIDVASANSGTNPPDNNSKVTAIIGFEKKDGGISRFIWVNETVIEDLEDYQARIMEVCAACGAEKSFDSDECPVCGKKKWKKIAREYEKLTEDIMLQDGRVIPAYQPKVLESGEVVPDLEHPTKIPYYRPNCFPLVLRKNVSVFGKLLGDSDVDKIADLQDRVNKLSTKVDEKLLKGGSVLMKHRNVSIKTDDSEFKVANVSNEQEIAAFKVFTLQPNISYDSAEIDKAHNTMREILGITPSYQGLPDKTATSGIAKQVAAAQSAGRLDSKRRMKDAAYSDLYKMLFKFKLAFSDEPRPTALRDAKGKMEYGLFDRYEFLEQDAAGEWYYNDEFTFSVDPSGSMAANREAMWQENRMNYQQGAYGPVGSPQSLLMFWSNMERQHYPGATENKQMAEEMYQQAQIQQQQQMQVAMEQEKTKQLQIMAKQPMPPGAFGSTPQEGQGSPPQQGV